MGAASTVQMNEKRWYVVQTRTFAEARAARELEQQGFDVFLPQYRKRTRHARKVTLVKAALFPSYLFVAMDLMRDRWRSINGTIGVARLIAASDKGPLPLACGVVEELQARRNDDGFIKMSRRAHFSPGESVRIRSGAFAEVFGLFEDFRDQDRVTVLLELLGGRVRVILDESLVEKVA